MKGHKGMSIEVKLDELTKSVLGLTEMMKITAANQERLIAGQAAAIEKVEPAKRTRSSKKEDSATGTEEKTPAAEPEKVEVVGRVVSNDELKEIGGKFLTAAKDSGPDALTAARDFMNTLLEEFGSPKLTGPETTLDAEQRKKAAFYIERKGAGLPVDLNADYDFDGDPTQAGGAVAATEDEDF